MKPNNILVETQNIASLQLKALAILKKNVPYNLLSSDPAIRPSDQHVREVILPEYLIAGSKGSVG